MNRAYRFELLKLRRTGALFAMLALLTSARGTEAQHDPTTSSVSGDGGGRPIAPG